MKPNSYSSFFGISIFLPLCAITNSANAIDSFSLEAGTGDRTDIVRVGAQWNWEKKWFQSNGTHISGYWDLAGAHWREKRYLNIPGNSNTFFDIGVTPVFRFQRDDRAGWYAEGGIGVHYLSDLYNNNGARLSTHFQFGDHVGFGYVFPNKVDIGLRLQHFSNGGYKKPNSGVDFAVLRIGYQF